MPKLEILKQYGINIQSPQCVEIYNDGQIAISNGYDFELSLKCNQEWKGYHAKIYAHLITLPENEQETEIKKIDYQDWHWDWLNKTLSTKDNDRYEWFFLQINSTVEAACLIHFPKESVLKPEEKIFYVEFIAVAPWNRYSPLESKRYKGLGSTILKKSIEYLVKKHSNSGRFSLHSLEQAEQFYVQKLNMEHCPSLDEPQLKYFELPPQYISDFLGL